jgi:predicted Zn-ribbon and HTH transcriptional regulator
MKRAGEHLHNEYTQLCFSSEVRNLGIDEGSLRERIAKFLESTEEPLTAEAIAQIFGIDVKDIYIHLTHIAKSVHRLSNGKKKLLMIPPRCKKCGYIFKDLDKPKKPSRCPRCKSEWIESPKFIIKELE